MKIRAWAVLVADLHEAPFRPFGNGRQWQYPIFPTRSEAQAWRNESRHNRGKIVRVTIEISGASA